MRLSSKEFSVESINGETLVKEISVRLENLFREREAAIQVSYFLCIVMKFGKMWHRLPKFTFCKINHIHCKKVN